MSKQHHVHHREHGDKPEWTPIEEQLAASKVIPGSALEKLVRENQNFDMLGPVERESRWKVPPWLLVYWRKQHPELTKDQGYPLTIKDIYAWMMSHQDLPGKKA
jgi:hypothetical protein